MFGYYDDSGYGGGWGRGRGFHHGGGFCHGGGYGYGYGPGRGFGRFGGFLGTFFGESQADTLKRYRDQLELHKKDLEAELKYVEDRIASLEKSQEQLGRRPG